MAQTRRTYHSECYCIEQHVKPKTRVTNTDIPPLNNFDFLKALTIYPTVTDRILYRLDLADLKALSKVDSSWCKLVEKALIKRSQSSWFTYYKFCAKPNKFVTKCSDNFGYSSIAVAIILVNSLHLSSVHSFVCLHSDDETFIKKPVAEFIGEDLVPDGVEYCIVSCGKVVSHFDPKIRATKDFGLPSTIDCIYFPKISNIRIETFHYGSRGNCSKTIEECIGAEDEVKCIFVLSTQKLFKTIRGHLSRLRLKNCNQPMAVGGGIIKDSKIFDKHVDFFSKNVYLSNNAFGIIFIKNKQVDVNFNAYSIVISSNIRQEDQFEDQLLEFKRKIVLRKEAVAIRICCKEKIYEDYETRIFTNVFPNIPLLGFTVNGEIGWNCFYENEDTVFNESESKRSKLMPTVYHEMSTIFLIITWGSIIK